MSPELFVMQRQSLVVVLNLLVWLLLSVRVEQTESATRMNANDPTGETTPTGGNPAFRHNQRRTSMSNKRRPHHPQFLSLFSPSEAVADKGNDFEKNQNSNHQSTKRRLKPNRRSSLITDAPPAPEEFTTTIPHDSISMHLQRENQQILEEVEITGLELLKRYDSDTADSFSYDSYALDSFAMAHKQAPQQQTQLNQSSMRYAHPPGSRSRVSAGSSSFGVNEYCYEYNDTLYNSSHHKGPSISNESMDSSLAYDYYEYGRNHRHPRRGSMGSFANDSVGRKGTVHAPHPPQHPNHHRRRMPRRSSTGMVNDLPGFGAYKARRASLGGGAMGVGMAVPGMRSGPLPRRRMSMGSIQGNRPMVFHHQQQESYNPSNSSIGNMSTKFGGSGSDLLKGSSHSIHSLSRRRSIGSISSGFSSGARPRH